jgi:hypothetical protein
LRVLLIRLGAVPTDPSRAFWRYRNFLLCGLRINIAQRFEDWLRSATNASARVVESSLVGEPVARAGLPVTRIGSHALGSAGRAIIERRRMRRSAYSAFTFAALMIVVQRATSLLTRAASASWPRLSLSGTLLPMSNRRLRMNAWQRWQLTGRLSAARSPWHCASATAPFLGPEQDGLIVIDLASKPPRRSLG